MFEQAKVAGSLCCPQHEASVPQTCRSTTCCAPCAAPLTYLSRFAQHCRKRRLRSRRNSSMKAGGFNQGHRRTWPFCRSCCHASQFLYDPSAVLTSARGLLLCVLELSIFTRAHATPGRPAADVSFVL